MENKLSTKLFYNNYEKYKDDKITKRRFTHSELLEIIKQNEHNEKFEIKDIGYSVEKRIIKLIKLGKGKTSVLLWSQMHGNESTATMAIADIINFFNIDDDFNDFRNSILENLTLYFVPMLNPDGAELFIRENSLGIDLNRDALRLQSPESKILKNLHDQIKPDFAFNLHDQNPLYSVGKSNKTATISLLAPPFNDKNEINEVRKNTMLICTDIFNEISNFIPGYIGRYNDEFEPRAFGDNFVRWGTSSVLIESGGLLNDPEKQFIRKLNFTAILTGFESIISKNYLKNDLSDYYKIPENEKCLFDLLIRNVTIIKNNENFVVDIGINKSEENILGEADYFLKSKVEEIGDLSIYYGNEELNCENMEIKPGKIFSETVKNYDELKNLDYVDLLKNGFTYLECNAELNKNYVPFPINIIRDNNFENNTISIESPANFIIKKDNRIIYTIINGFVYEIGADKIMIKNGLVYK